MTINNRELIQAAEIVARQKNMKVALQYTAAASTFTGLTTMGGGLLAGPVGLAIGAMVGGISSFLYSQGQFKPVVEIIQELTPQQQQRLAQHLRNAVKDIDCLDLITLTSLLMSKEQVLMTMATALTSFLKNDLKYQLQ